MSNEDVNVILIRLQHLEDMLCQIHDEVKRTNGRVTALELQEARWKGENEGKHMQRMIMTSVISGALLAGVLWFVSTAI